MTLCNSKAMGWRNCEVHLSYRRIHWSWKVCSMYM